MAPKDMSLEGTALRKSLSPEHHDLMLLKGMLALQRAIVICLDFSLIPLKENTCIPSELRPLRFSTITQQN